MLEIDIESKKIYLVGYIIANDHGLAFKSDLNIKDSSF